MRPRKRGEKAMRPARAFDCETIDGRIVLFLSCGADGQADYLYDPAGLQIDDILQWILIFAADLCIGYFFDYDVQQIVKQLPPHHQMQLWRRGRVLYGHWRIRHVPRKRFTITDTETKLTVTIWDVSGWTQCSFVRLITDWNIGTEEEKAFVARMKALREDLSHETKDSLVRYTTLECKLLSIWFLQMLALHRRANIHLTAYSGAGSTASAMFRAAKWKPPDVPSDVQQYAEAAFFGGRTETSRVGGYTGIVYGYDINSAYPYAICHLPEIRNARWKRTKRFIAGAWGFYRARWRQKQTECWGLFPVRGAKMPDGHRSVSLLFAQSGEGIYHSYEIEAALQCYPSAIEIMDGWIIDPHGKPFEWVYETVERRLKLKAEGDSANIVLKLGLNSLYGKMAQHTGTHPLQCMVYAAAITAKTRAMMLPLLSRHQHDILLVATDGILSAVPLDVPVSPALGEWEHSQYTNAWILQAGVYWCGNKIRTRGVDGRQLDLDAIRAVWRRRKTEGEIPVRVRRVISYRAACARGKPELTGSWVEMERIVRFDPRPRRRPYRWTEEALLTLPAAVREYQVQMMADTISLANAFGNAYDDGIDAMPDWAFE